MRLMPEHLQLQVAMPMLRLCLHLHLHLHVAHHRRDLFLRLHLVAHAASASFREATTKNVLMPRSRCFFRRCPRVWIALSNESINNHLRCSNLFNMVRQRHLLPLFSPFPRWLHLVQRLQPPLPPSIPQWLLRSNPERRMDLRCCSK
jgi:hypothetical protein